ncbi:hypothetical protein DM02DRAFT_269494 [Periconia macrospinosa]|uniref:Uncharacterized protein n=1 Tax=Periconia macrospinosa TaxID=97972 RepID=A0A2V1D3M4_9PLEO|nr:hypothetical protein DM02DRAFT_269494 [Periconia macrospinosa]
MLADLDGFIPCVPVPDCLPPSFHCANRRNSESTLGHSKSSKHSRDCFTVFSLVEGASAIEDYTRDLRIVQRERCQGRLSSNR